MHKKMYVVIEYFWCLLKSKHLTVDSCFALTKLFGGIKSIGALK